MEIVKRIAIVIAPWIFTLWFMQVLFAPKEYPVSTIIFLTLLFSGGLIMIVAEQWRKSK